MTNSYFELQNSVYEALMQKHSEDESFCFTLRKNYDKNTYLNYFTGTETSNYFTFSLWYIKNSYPGASVDPLVYRVILREDYLRIELQLHQTKAPEDKQNELVLKLLQNIRKGLKNSFIENKYALIDDVPDNRMFKIAIRPKNNVTDKESLIRQLLELITDTAPIIDLELNPIKSADENFDAQRVTKNAFEKMISDRNNRREKLKETIPTFKEIVSEVININNLETDPPFYFNTINDTYVWIGDKSELIGNRRAHYEIQHNESRDYSHVLIHFEDEYATEIKNALGRQLPKHFSWYDWHKGEGIRIGGFEMSKEPNTPSILFEKLKEAKNLLGDKLREILKKLPTSNTPTMKPLNQILYGPPGTGKTYRLKTDFFPKYTTKETAITPDQHFEEVVRELTWWQVIAIAVIELGKCKVGDLMKHRWVIQKAKLSNSNTVRPTLWGQLQSHTIESCEFVNVKSKQQPFIFNKTEDSYWEILEDEVKEFAPELYDIIESVNNFQPNPEKEIKRYVFTTFHQSFNYEDFIEGIKPILNNEQESDELKYRIEDGIFKELCKRADSDPTNQYAIFIDEINRGNVSAIFGELITLIETDKRKDGEHPMSANLPYSKKPFTVPSNVDIIGTMNTADRSVEALDTALRRRFSFIEMLPRPELLENNIIEGINLALLLKMINNRIEALVDRDHTIGHAYFMKVDSILSLQETFAKNIIPLLQEYFYGNYAKMEMVIGPYFFENNSKPSKVLFAVMHDEFGDYNKRNYQLHDISKMTESDFMDAIKRLLDPKFSKEKASEMVEQDPLNN